MKIGWDSIVIIFLAVIVASIASRRIVNINKSFAPATQTSSDAAVAPQINSLEDYIRVHYPGALS